MQMEWLCENWVQVQGALLVIFFSYSFVVFVFLVESSPPGRSRDEGVGGQSGWPGRSQHVSCCPVTVDDILPETDAPRPPGERRTPKPQQSSTRRLRRRRLRGRLQLQLNKLLPRLGRLAPRRRRTRRRRRVLGMGRSRRQRLPLLEA
jgi:hypothetical protein